MTWKKEIRQLWKRVGELSGEFSGQQKNRRFKGRKWFGVAIEGRRANPGNTSIRKLFSGERF